MSGGILLPLGGFILAFTPGNGPWPAPLVGVAVMCCGVFQIYVCENPSLGKKVYSHTAIFHRTAAVRDLLRDVANTNSDRYFGSQLPSRLLRSGGIIGASGTGEELFHAENVCSSHFEVVS